jgi:hypothetical protein
MPHPRPRRSRQLNGLPGDPLDARQASSQAEALSQIDDRNVYGAYEAATNHLFVASAANRATAIALEATFDRAAAAQGGPAVRVTDVKPLLPKDSNGTAVFYSMIAWVFGGYIASTLIGLLGSPRSSSRRRAAARLAALSGFSIVVGILSVVILRASFDVFSGHVVALCAIAALTMFASGTATAGIQAALGPSGTGLVILLFVILGKRRLGRAVRSASSARLLEDDRWCAAAGGQHRSGAVGSVLRRRADHGADPGIGGRGPRWHAARASAGRPRHGSGRPRGRGGRGSIGVSI